jgi:hypothetical protein
MEDIRKEQEKAAAKAEAERCETEMVRYEVAKIRYHAAGRLALARTLSRDVEAEKAKGHEPEAERLFNRAKVRFQEVIDNYPDTDAALDAKAILDGNTVPLHPMPPVPILPVGVTASEEELVDKPKLPPGPSRFVYVRGYKRKDGVSVLPHFAVVPS